MKPLILALLLCTSFVVAQDNRPANQNDNAKHDGDAVTVRGCVSRSNGDYILMKQNPAMTYELQAAGKIRLHDYLGQMVEVSGPTSPTLSSSSDAMNKTGSAAPVTISVKTIKTIDKECELR